MNGLAALRDPSTPVRIVVINNDGGGIFEFLPQAEQVDREEFEAILGTPLGIDPAKVAELYGLPPPLGRRYRGVGSDRRGSERRSSRSRSSAVATSRSTAGSRTARARRFLRSAGDERQQGPELQLGLGKLGIGTRVRDDARAGEQMGGAVAQQSAAEARRRTRRPPPRPSSRPARRTSRDPGSRARRSPGAPARAAHPRRRVSDAAARRVRPRTAARRAGRGWASPRCWMFATLTSSGSAAASTQTE